MTLLMLGVSALIAQTVFHADSTRGGQLFDTLHCVECHAMNGKGNSIGPDLGRIADRGFTPATLAATMWNHAPAMWSAMRQQGIAAGNLDERAASDLFAYFYAARFFEQPGDSGRGKRVFAARGCVDCHALPVKQWNSLADPIALTEAMWNHAPVMLASTQMKRKTWPRLEARELSDVLVYLRNSPFRTEQSPLFQIGDDTDGGAAFEVKFRAKGCASCHATSQELTTRMRGKTLTEVAAAMWNHEPLLANAAMPPVKFEAGEMKQFLSYLWAPLFFEDSGSPLAGRRVFVSKRCAACHDSGTAPRLTTASMNGASMVAVLWRHGPSMLSQMESQRIRWPRFESSQMADLIAYLNLKR